MNSISHTDEFSLYYVQAKEYHKVYAFASPFIHMYVFVKLAGGQQSARKENACLAAQQG